RSRYLPCPIPPSRSGHCIKREPRYQAVSSHETSPVYFDHLVGELLELQGDVEAEPLGSFEIDDQFKPGWSLHRQVGRLPAPEDAGRADRASRLRIRRLKTSTYWLERVFDHVGRDLRAHVLAGADRESIVNAAPDADILLLLSHIGQAGELPRSLRIAHIGRGERDNLQGTAYPFPDPPPDHFL